MSHIIFFSKIKIVIDTDSVFIAVSKSDKFPSDFEKDFYQTWRACFNKIVKPSKMQSWIAKSPDWFVLTQQVEHKRQPGLLKPEFISTNGVFVGLCPKSYIISQYDEEGNAIVKNGAKGVQKSVRLTEEAYRQSLFENDVKMVPFNSLQLNSRKQMVRVSTTKKGLTDTLSKIVVHSDRVTCSHLKRKGNFI